MLSQLPEYILNNCDPRFLFGIDKTLTTLNRLNVPSEDIESLFMNPQHTIYFKEINCKVMYKKRLDLFLNENDEVDIYVSGLSVHKFLASRDCGIFHNSNPDDNLTQIITVIHQIEDIELLEHYVQLLNNENNFCVLNYKTHSWPKYPEHRFIHLEVDCPIVEKAVKFATIIKEIMKDKWLHIRYPHPTVHWASYDTLFIQSNPTTKCGLVVEKQKDCPPLHAIQSYLKSMGFSNILLIKEDELFHGYSFEATYVYLGKLYESLSRLGYIVKLFGDVNDGSFSSYCKNFYLHRSWRVGPVSRGQISDYESFLMSSLIQGEGEQEGR